MKKNYNKIDRKSILKKVLLIFLLLLELKTKLLKDVFSIVVPEDWGEDGKYGANTFKETESGGFSLLYDEV